MRHTTVSDGSRAASAATEPFWEEHLSQGAQALVSSAIRDLLQVTTQPEMISFAGGLPAPDCFPVAALADAATRVLANAPALALQYGPTEGYRPLRAWLAERLRALGIPVDDEHLLITSGSQQGLDLLGKLLIDPGDLVAVEAPTYLGALQAWRPYRPRFVTLPVDAAGLQVEALEALLQAGVRPRFLYLVSSFQNPTGITLSLERRQALVAVAARYRLPIIEDDPYGDLAYDGERAEPLAALDARLHGELRQVVYLSTFSKLLAPGLRVAWVAAPAALRQRLVQAKQGLDLHTGSLAQAIAFEACQDGLLARHLPLLRQTYRARRDAMVQALARHMPAGTSWTEPAGGLFVWVTLAAGQDGSRVLRSALEQQVAFVPGAAFYANGGGANTLRLNFSYCDPATIETGVVRLSRSIAECATGMERGGA